MDEPNNRTKEILTSMLNAAHPKMAAAIRVAAIPHWYDVPLFSAIRHEDDGKSDGVVERLTRYSFVIPVLTTETPNYRVRSEERHLLNTEWVGRDPASFVAAHHRAYEYLVNHKIADQHQHMDQVEPSLIEIYPQLYHHFFVDLDEANRELTRFFRTLYKERKLGAIDSLIEMLNEVHALLQLLPVDSYDDQDDTPSGDIHWPRAESLRQFETLRVHYGARALQLRGNWQESLEQVRPLRHSTDLPDNLAPYVIRSYGSALAKTEQFVDGIVQLEEAIETFRKLPPDPSEPLRNEIEQAYTMIELGDAFVDFAQAVRGFSVRDSADVTWRQRLRDVGAFLLNGPLILYLSRFLGRRVWLPGFWSTLHHLDWIVARLFARAVNLYEKADTILERTDAVDEHVLADEKLAFLYVVLGDARQARFHFQQLLNDDSLPLSDFRRASISLGIAWTYAQQGEYQTAIDTLVPVLPTLESSQDEALLEHTQELLAEAYMATGQASLAADRFSRAMDYFGARQAERPATNLIERLELLLSIARHTQQDWVEETISDLRERSATLRQRVYEIGYHHPGLTYFRQLLALLIPGAIVIGLLVTFNLETTLELQPDLDIYVPPLLNPLEVASSQLSQGITGTTLISEPNASAAFQYGSLFLSAFFLLSLLTGVGAILLTPLSQLQRHREKVVTIDDEAIAIGPPDEQIRVRWEDVTQQVRANVGFWKSPLRAHSSVALHSKDFSLIIPGATNWYAQLTQRLGSFAPNVSKHRDCGYSVMRSWFGLGYLTNIAILLVLLLLAKFGGKDLLWRDFPGTPYSVVDLYPMIYLGAALVPTWWAVIRPLQIQLQTGRVSRTPWIVVGFGSVIALMLVATMFRPLFTVPDIYPTVVIVPSMVMAAATVWYIKDGSTRYYGLRTRAIVAAGTLIVALLLTGVVQRDVRSYHYLVMGNTQRDLEQYDAAIEHYQRAVNIGRQKAWGIFDPVRAIRPKRWPASLFGLKLGIPSQESISWFAAQKNLAALQSQQGYSDEAITNYTQLIDAVCWPTDDPTECGEEQEKFLAWRAIALSRAATSTRADGGIDASIEEYNRAIQDYEKAIELAPDKYQYHLWSGFTHQALAQFDDARKAYREALNASQNDPLLPARVATLLGWVDYEERNYDSAIEQFSTAILTATKQLSSTQYLAADQVSRVAVDPFNEIRRDALRGKGYASYEQGRQLSSRFNENLPEDIKNMVRERYRAAEEAWSQIESDADYDILKSLATLHWSMAQLTDADEIKCQEWDQAAGLFVRSVLPEQPARERAFAYRSLAQIEWLLRSCAGFDRLVMIERSINSYSQALNFSDVDDQFHAYYVHMRARISYVMWLEKAIDRTRAGYAEQVEVLVQMMADFQYALELDPVDRLLSSDPDDARSSLFDYEPNGFARKNVLPSVLRQIEEAIKVDDQETVDTLWTALRGLIPYINGANRSLNIRYTAIPAVQEGRPIAEDDQYALILQEALALSEPDGPIVTLIEAQRAYDMGQQDEALSLYEQVEKADFVQGYPGILTARHMAALSLTFGEIDEAAFWYGQLLSNSTASEFGIYRDARSDLGRIWQDERVAPSADRLLQALNTALDQLVNDDPKLEQNGLFWNRSAWFKYTIGLEAFRLGDEETAKLALELAQPDADRSAALKSNLAQNVTTYLPEGAWGWYHMVRGDDAMERGDFAAALADYAGAHAAYRPNTNQVAQSEHIAAAAKAGLTSLLLNRNRNAMTWYGRVLDLADSYNQTSPVSIALANLRGLEVFGRSTRATQARIADNLQSWLDDQAGD